MPRIVRRLPLAVPAVLALAAPALAWDGASLRSVNVRTNYAAAAALVKVNCPGGTQSTSRIGDFSFCTGFIRISWRGATIGTAPVALRTNDHITQQVPLISRVRTYLRHNRHMSGVHFLVRAHDGQGQWVTHRATGTLRDDFHDVI